MDRDTRLAAMHWLEQRIPAVVVEIADARGSAPRGAGTRMLVSAVQAIGTIGGGHLEFKALATAKAMLAARDAGPRRERFPLGPALGQCCGGAVTLRFARLDARIAHDWPATTPRFVLQLYGAGHVGRAIVRLLAGIPCEVQWIDERENEFPADVELPPHIERVCVDPVEAEVDVAPAGACYLVLTHRHDLDMRIAEAILRRGDFGFLGLIGSQTKRARFRNRYEQRGIPAATLDRMTCPIGVPGIDGKEPDVIAVAVVAQLLQLQLPAAAPTGAAQDVMNLHRAAPAHEPRYVL